MFALKNTFLIRNKHFLKYESDFDLWIKFPGRSLLKVNDPFICILTLCTYSSLDEAFIEIDNKIVIVLNSELG